MDAYLALVDQLIDKKVLKTPRIVEAFKVVHRKFFLLEQIAESVGLDVPLPIGGGQTNSQPYTVAFMLELLSPKQGQKVLDIGFGSGWTSALLAHIVGRKGKVYAFEVVRELYEFGKKNIEKLGFIRQERVKVFCKNAATGAPEFAPFDRILVSAAAQNLPRQWVLQLATNGRLVAPVRHSIWLIEKHKDKIKRKEYPGFSFVPLV